MDSSRSRRVATWLVGTVLAMSLVACGGGGGGGTDAGGDGGGGDGGGGGGGGGSSPPTGRLWHDDYALDYLDGTQIASLSGAAPVQVTAELQAQPWADATQYVTADSSDIDSTTVRVYALAGGAQLYAAKFQGYLREVRPSPVSKSVILATWGEDSVSTAYAVFYDFASDKVLDMFEIGDAPVSWLPDGRYLRVAEDGTVSTGTVGASATSTGSLSMPAGRSITSVSVSPNGSQMVMSMVVPSNGGGIDEGDLWIANINGSGLRRFTNTKITGYGVWSPDSKLVAFSADTGLVCGGGYCAGSCEIWYGKASASNLDALTETDDQAQFRVKNRNGSTFTLGCDVNGWTR